MGRMYYIVSIYWHKATDALKRIFWGKIPTIFQCSGKILYRKLRSPCYRLLETIISEMLLLVELNGVP